MSKPKTWCLTAAALTAFWAGLAAGLAGLRALETRPDTVVRYVDQTPWDTLAPPEQARALETLARHVTQLPPEERTNAQVARAIRGWFETRTPEERERYLELTLPRGLEQMTQALNAMTPEQRRGLIEQASENLDASLAESLPDLSDPHMQRLIQQGIQTFLEDASPETQLDLLPLLQRMQDVLRETRS
ncbi:MAG: hypothetical protein AAGG38_09945 [Planctomycetota bacterium]